MRVKEVIELYKKSLQNLYPEGELSQIIFLVFEHVKNFSKIDLTLEKEEIISDDEKEKFDHILSELKTHKPVQYVLGYSWFYGIKLKVNENVLIPRQETEELVAWIIEDSKVTNRKSKIAILDVCTGSGCIAISLKKNIPHADVTGLDVSEEALAVAKENSKINGASINFIQTDILRLRTPNSLPALMKDELRQASELPTNYDLIVSNPPYVLESEKANMKKKELSFEPHLAFFVTDTDPLIFYKCIADFGVSHLKPGGCLYFEINETKGKEVAGELASKGFSEVEVRKDLNGKERMVKAILKSQRSTVNSQP